METPVSSPQLLKDLVGYQNGAVVSRVLLRHPSGDVTLFGFAAGEGLREHTSTHAALVIGVEGESAWLVDGEACSLRTGEMLQLPANIPHAVRAVTDFKMLLVLLRDRP